jgi:hypothetical protein
VEDGESVGCCEAGSIASLLPRVNRIRFALNKIKHVGLETTTSNIYEYIWV